jgi:hypothetical protein
MMGKYHEEYQGKCPDGEHDIRVSASKCGKCGIDLCELCGSDEHFTSEGHDLSRPEYWGV